MLEAAESATQDAEALQSPGVYQIKVGSETYYEIDVSYLLLSSSVAEAGIPPPAILPANLFFDFTNGDDATGDGSFGNPVKTINQALTLASQDDIIEGIGSGTTVYTDYVTITQSFGTSNPVTIRIAVGLTYNFYPSGSGNDIGVFTYDGCAGIEIDGSLGTMNVSDPALWAHNTGDDNTTCGRASPNDNIMRGENGANHLEIHHVNMFGSRTAKGFFPADGTSHFYVHHNTFDTHGCNNDTHSVQFGNDRGDMLSVRGDHHIITNNMIIRGGHTSFGTHMNFSYVGGNTFDQDWTPKSTGFPGNRTMDVQSGSNRTGSTSPYGQNLFELNIYKNGGASVDNANNPIGKFSGRHDIMRYAYVFDCQGFGLKQSIPTGAVNISNTQEESCIYNVTFFEVGGFIDLGSGRSGQLNVYKNMHYVNNIVEVGPATGGRFIEWSALDATVGQQGFPDDWLGAEIRNNMGFSQDSDYAIRMRDTGGSTTKDWFTDAETEWPNVLSGNSKNQATFVDSGARTIAGFALQAGSNGEDESEHLTTVTANSSGTLVTMGYNFWIWDAEGLFEPYMAAAGIGPDYVAFYSAAMAFKGIRRVVKGGKSGLTQATFDSPITLVIGDLMLPSLGGSESDVVLNMGASQV